MQVESAPKVSVCVVTYNQEKYIGQCLQSLVDQQTNFPFEIIVSDDCSTDGTATIVKDFKNKYPDLVKIFCHDKNMGGSDNYLFVHAQAAGEYIAHMDGDDYALPGKLQKQADFLDVNAKCNIVWTPVLIETGPGTFHEQNTYFKKYALTKTYQRADLIKFGAVGVNSAKMYRRSVSAITTPPPIFGLIDYFVNAAQVGEGTARFIGEKPLGVYRAGIGVASSGSATKYLTLRSIAYLAKIFPEHRLECNVAALFHFLSDMKNKRQSVKLSATVFFKTLHWKTIFIFPSEYKFLKHLTVQNKDV